MTNTIEEEKLNHYMEQLEDLERTLENTPFKMEPDIIDEVKKFKKEIERMLGDDSVPIKVVVTGRMKAGKSMMIDVLFFNGSGVLRSDTIPATANITYIRCADAQHKEGARVSFLTEKDVNEMRNYLEKQSKDGLSDDVFSYADKLKYEATKEQLEKMEANPEIMAELIGARDKEITLEQLKNYSDAGGEYSDFVNQIEIYINEPRIKDLTIVDTPGLGDPIASRTAKAHDESRTAEVVFYLSSAAHFMDMEDSAEFSELKRAGCKNMVVVMSRLDEVLNNGDDEEFADLKDTDSYWHLSEEGAGRIKKAMEREGITYEPVDIIPIIALGSKLSRHVLEKDDDFFRNSLAPFFPDWTNQDDVDARSGITELQERIDKENSKKDEIRKATIERFMNEFRDNIIHICQSIKSRIEEDIRTNEDTINNLGNGGEKSIALDDLERTVCSQIEQTLGKLYSDKILVQCDGRKNEINEAAKNAKKQIEEAKSPNSINAAYEYAFKNEVDDMFVNGIEAILRLDTSEKFGGMFEFFRNEMKKISVPQEIDYQTFKYILEILKNEFEYQIRTQYDSVIKDALPQRNIRKILQEGFDIVRSESLEFKYKENPWKWTGRLEKNNNAIASCKRAVDDAETKLSEVIEFFCNNKLNQLLLEDIKRRLTSVLNNNIEGKKDKYARDDKESLEDEITENKKLIEAIEGLNILPKTGEEIM